MKKIIYLIALLVVILNWTNTLAQSAFTAGDLVVEKIGTGAALTSGATPVAIVEYNTAGVLIQTVPFNNSATVTSPPNLTAAGTSGNDGFPTISTDGSFLVVPGYNATNGTASIGGTSNNRVIGWASANGSTSIPLFNLAFLNGNNFRGATGGPNSTFSGFDYWGSGGANVNYVSGTGVVASPQLVTVNSRCIGIFNGQLYYSTGSGTQGVYKVGTGLPTSGAQTVTIIGASTNPDMFSFNPAHDILYIADEGAFGAGGGIKKYTRSGATWSLAYILNNSGALTTSARGLAVDWSGASPVLYLVDAAASANKIYKVISITLRFGMFIIFTL